MASPSDGLDPRPGFSMDFDPKYRVLRVSAVGVVTDRTLYAVDGAVRQFLSAEGADLGIFDYSAATEFQVTARCVRSFAAKKAANPPMKLRIAIAPQPAAYGLNRMYGVLIEGKRSDFQVVRTMEEAEELIGLGKLDFCRKL